MPSWLESSSQQPAHVPAEPSQTPHTPLQEDPERPGQGETEQAETAVTEPAALTRPEAAAEELPTAYVEDDNQIAPFEEEPLESEEVQPNEFSSKPIESPSPTSSLAPGPAPQEVKETMPSWLESSSQQPAHVPAEPSQTPHTPLQEDPERPGQGETEQAETAVTEPAALTRPEARREAEAPREPAEEDDAQIQDDLGRNREPVPPKHDDGQSVERAAVAAAEELPATSVEDDSRVAPFRENPLESQSQEAPSDGDLAVPQPANEEEPADANQHLDPLNTLHASEVAAPNVSPAHETLQEQAAKTGNSPGPDNCDAATAKETAIATPVLGRAPEEPTTPEVQLSSAVEAAASSMEPCEVEEDVMTLPQESGEVPEAKAATVEEDLGLDAPLGGSEEEYEDDIQEEQQDDTEGMEGMIVPASGSEQRQVNPALLSDEEESPRSHRSTKRYTPRRLPMPKPPTEEEAFSEAALRKRAEQRLKHSMQLASMNIPSVTNYPKPFGGRIELSLDTLSAEAQRSFLRVARFEAEAWLRQQQQSCEAQARVAKRQERILGQIAEWRERKDKEEQEERRRVEELERQNEEREQKERERWRKRGEELRQCLADWAAEKSQQELERSQAAEKAQKEEEEKRRQKEQRYREKQRELLLEWNRQKMDKLEEQRLAEQMEEEKEAAEAAKKQSDALRGRRRKVMKRVKEGPKRRPMPRSAATSNDPTVIEDAGSDAKSSA